VVVAHAVRARRRHAPGRLEAAAPALRAAPREDRAVREQGGAGRGRVGGGGHGQERADYRGFGNPGPAPPGPAVSKTNNWRLPSGNPRILCPSAS
jgi:hypothetical protein